MQTLKEIKPGVTVRVVKIGGGGPMKRRIMEMGISKGAKSVDRCTRFK